MSSLTSRLDALSKPRRTSRRLLMILFSTLLFVLSTFFAYFEPKTLEFSDQYQYQQQLPLIKTENNNINYDDKLSVPTSPPKISNENSEQDLLQDGDFAVLDRSEEGDVIIIPATVPPQEAAVIDEKERHFYEDRFLPRPQLDFYPRSGRQLKYQMHNCLKGRDGSKAGLLDAGIPRVLSQKSLVNMPLHIIDPWSSIIVACNSKFPMHQLSRNPRAAGIRLISSCQGILSKLCLGSTKTRQLDCRRELSSRWGCTYESLNIQPAQFVLSNPSECEEIFIQGNKRDRSWLSKPSGGIRGRGIKYFANTKSLFKEIERIGGCSQSNRTGIRGRLVQEYVSEPALIDGKYKFDVRTWLLIASVDPLVIFYHEGFVRVAKQVYSEFSRNKMVHITNAFGQNDPSRRYKNNGEEETENENDGSEEDEDIDSENGKYMRSFDHVSYQMNRTHGLPRDFMQNEYRKQMMKAQAFAALSQFTIEDPKDIITKKGFYQIYACDSMVDRHGKAHLLECNGFPAEIQQQTVTGKQIWGEMMALLLNLHLEPWRLLKDSTPPPMIGKYRYKRDGYWKTGTNLVNGDKLKANEYAFGGWHLAFNELETPLKSYNVCSSSI